MGSCGNFTRSSPIKQYSFSSSNKWVIDATNWFLRLTLVLEIWNKKNPPRIPSQLTLWLNMNPDINALLTYKLALVLREILAAEISLITWYGNMVMTVESMLTDLAHCSRKQLKILSPRSSISDIGWLPSAKHRSCLGGLHTDQNPQEKIQGLFGTAQTSR